MSVCYFKDEKNKRYKCEYEFKENAIEVMVDYDVKSEISSVNGVKMFGINTEIEERDIIIVDHEKRTNFYLKSAYLMGSFDVLGTIDCGSKSKFKTKIYFEHSDFNKLIELPDTPKINRIKVFSKTILDFIGIPSMSIESTEKKQTVSLFNSDIKKEVMINTSNVKKISISDGWKMISQKYNITIDFNGYIELELTKRTDFDKISEFVFELKVFFQLYYPNKFVDEKLYVMVNGEYFILHFPKTEIKYTDKYVKATVNDDLLTFLEKCYKSIPYRKSKTEFRNIPYIVMKTSRSIEDNFLMFYRFIECYYKKQSIPNIKKNFISYSIRNNYKTEKVLSEEQIENYSQEIISLRNQYVHAGYFLKNSCLRVTFDRINRKKSSKDYTVNNIDFSWIYERTNMLYKIAIDIIYSNMLGYTNYDFNKNF